METVDISKELKKLQRRQDRIYQMSAKEVIKKGQKNLVLEGILILVHLHFKGAAIKYD